MASIAAAGRNDGRNGSTPKGGDAARKDPTVAIVHDYLTQRGGAERVVLSMLHAFPQAELYTSLYQPSGTFRTFGEFDIHTLGLDRIQAFRRDHRLALPLYAPAFSHLEVDADVVLCSSSGWAHGVRTPGRKVVYCHTPARWLYQPGDYLGDDPRRLARTALAVLRPGLLRWDRLAAGTASRYLANSSVVSERIRSLYGIEPEILPPPPSLFPAGPREPVEGLEPGFFLCVARLMPYKNVDAVVRAFRRLPGQRLAVVGSGPEAARLRAAAGENVIFLGAASDETLRWLYANCRAVVAASYEDYGLTPLEAASFGKPAVVLRWGGFLDTTVEGRTGIFFDEPTPEAITEAIDSMEGMRWSEEALLEHTEHFSEEHFVERLHEVVLEESLVNT